MSNLPITNVPVTVNQTASCLASLDKKSLITLSRFSSHFPFQRASVL